MAPSVYSAVACALAILAPSATAFAPSASHAQRSFSSSLSVANEGSDVSRRGFMENMASATASIAGVSSVWMTPSPALAYGLKKANEKLARCVIGSVASFSFLVSPVFANSLSNL